MMSDNKFVSQESRKKIKLKTLKTSIKIGNNVFTISISKT